MTRNPRTRTFAQEHPEHERAARELFAGRGEMRRLCRELDWAATPLGPVSSWSVSLRTTLTTLLASRHPMFLFWGPELVQAYNDAYRPSLAGGGRHPRALGMRGREFWTEIWDIIGPQIDTVMSGGGATWNVDQLVPIERNGRIEEVYWTYSYGPVQDDDGHIAGTLVVCQETTDRVVWERRVRTQIRMASIEPVGSPAAVAKRAVSALAEDGMDARFALCFLADKPLDPAGSNGSPVLPKLIHAEGVPPGSSWLDPGAWDLHELARSRHIFVVELDRNGDHDQDDWPGPPTRAAVASIEQLADRSPTGALVVGLSPRLPWNAAYEEFVRGAAHQIATHVAVRRAQAERERLLRETEAARAAAEQANRAKAQFLANMSHELRTPLNAIGGYAELLQLGVHGPVTDEQAKALQRIRASQHHLLGLINQVLNYTRLDSGAVAFEMVAVGVADALASSEALIAPQAQSKGLKLEVHLPGSDLRVEADQAKLQQILLNLLSNAVKFTEPGGAISVRARPEGDRVAIDVADTGRGIATTELDQIFDPFVQVDAQLTRTEQGAGLGLAISRELALGMHGDLTARSEPGRGSTFTLVLPRSSAPEGSNGMSSA